MRDNVEIRFGDWFNEGLRLFGDNVGLLVLATLLTVVLSVLTFGILAGPLSAGLVLILLRLCDGNPSPRVTDIFEGFDYFLHSLLFFAVWGVATMAAQTVAESIPCVGQLAAVAVPFVLNTFLMFGLFLIVDKSLSFWDASVESFHAVQPFIWPLFGLNIVASLIGMAGALACIIGLVVTMPIFWSVMVVVYRDFFPLVASPQGTPRDTIDAGPEMSQRAPDVTEE